MSEKNEAAADRTEKTQGSYYVDLSRPDDDCPEMKAIWSDPKLTQDQKIDKAVKLLKERFGKGKK